jgi:hypothetical protein
MHDGDRRRAGTARDLKGREGKKKCLFEKLPTPENRARLHFCFHQAVKLTKETKHGGAATFL